MSRAPFVFVMMLAILTFGTLTGCPKPAAQSKDAPATRVPVTQTEPSPEPAEEPQAADSGDEITWLTDYDAALKQAGEEGKLVMIDIFSMSCPPCRQLDAETWPDPKVVEMSSNFVCLRINTAENSEVPNKYNTMYIPHIVFTDAEGNSILDDVGYKSPEKMVSFMEQALGEKTE